jgi:hypothetical protein
MRKVTTFASMIISCSIILIGFNLKAVSISTPPDSKCSRYLRAV